MKRIRLAELKTVDGYPFREAVVDGSGNPILDPAKDSEGKNIPGRYIQRDKEVAIALPMLLKRIYFNIPELTRQDTIYGTKLLMCISKLKEGADILELDEDIHDWIKKKLQDEKCGVVIFRQNLSVVEDAVNNFERLHEKEDAK